MISANHGILVMTIKNEGITPTIKEELLDDLQDFLKTTDHHEVFTLIVMAKGKDVEIASNSCICCHVEALGELIKVRRLKHEHETS